MAAVGLVAVARVLAAVTTMDAKAGMKTKAVVVSAISQAAAATMAVEPKAMMTSVVEVGVSMRVVPDSKGVVASGTRRPLGAERGTCQQQKR